MAVFTTSSARPTINTISKALATIGLALPEDITAPIETPDIAKPTDADITRAIIAADGDPAADPEVQRLITAKALDGYAALIEHERWRERGQALADARDTINTQIHDVFNAAARELEDAAPHLQGYESLDNIVLSTLPARVEEPARRAINAQHTLRATLDAWKKLWVNVGGQQTGRPGAIITIVCDPAPDEWREHASRRPNSLPEPWDVWTPARYGWTLTLAHDLRDAKARHGQIEGAISRDREARQFALGRATSWGQYR